MIFDFRPRPMQTVYPRIPEGNHIGTILGFALKTNSKQPPCLDLEIGIAYEGTLIPLRHRIILHETSNNNQYLYNKNIAVVIANNEGNRFQPNSIRSITLF